MSSKHFHNLHCRKSSQWSSSIALCQFSPWCFLWEKKKKKNKAEEEEWKIQELAKFTLLNCKGSVTTAESEEVNCTVVF